MSAFIFRVLVIGCAAIYPAHQDLSDDQNDSKAANAAQSIKSKALIRIHQLGGVVRSQETSLGTADDIVDIDLSDTMFSDEDIWAILACKHILSLDLSNTLVTDDGLKHLNKFADLFYLNLTNTRIGNNGISRIARIKSLEQLDLTNTYITNHGLRVLARGATSLKALNISGTRLDDKSIKYISLMDGLQTITMYRSRFTDAGLGGLSRLSSLQNLALGGEDITDASLGVMEKLPHLHMLALVGTRMTYSGVSSLRQKHDKLTIYFESQAQ